MYLYYAYEMGRVDGLPAFGMFREIASRFKVQNQTTWMDGKDGVQRFLDEDLGSSVQLRMFG